MNELRVFIVGPARSGTSALYYAISTVFGLPGPGESHVMPAFQRVVHWFFDYCRQFTTDEDLLVRQLNPADFRTYVTAYLRNFYATQFPQNSFIDKTPGAEAIAGAQFIRRVFPDARIIVTLRSGIEVVASHMRKFQGDFREACGAWTACMTAVEEMRPLVDDMLELEHHLLATQPDAASARIAAYLGEPEHAAELAAFFRDNKLDQLSEHHWSERLTLDNVGWTEEQKETFRSLCGGQMLRFGYPM